MRAKIILLLLILNVIFNQCLAYPHLSSKTKFGSNLNSTLTNGVTGNTESQASAQGLGSTVGISGIVTGDVAGTVGATSDHNSSPSSSISSSGNCSDYSASNAQGSNNAAATSTGNCAVNLQSAGDFDQKVVIGMESQVNSNQNVGGQNPGQQPEPAPAMINQQSSQYPVEGSAEAYQFVQGHGTNSFSGVMASQGDHVVAGTSETLMSHAIGQTSVETVMTPFIAISDQMFKGNK